MYGHQNVSSYLQCICNIYAQLQFNPLTTVRGKDYKKLVPYLVLQLKKK